MKPVAWVVLILFLLLILAVIFTGREESEFTADEIEAFRRVISEGRRACNRITMAERGVTKHGHIADVTCDSGKVYSIWRYGGVYTATREGKDAAE